ncbi:Rid family hydrolase [Paraburkholderia sp.]|uniref:Rid family hydrolase n=1 Tax=Paraburkholderia sp. TaxID=1926495 RepID=UPI003D6FD5FA
MSTANGQRLRIHAEKRGVVALCFLIGLGSIVPSATARAQAIERFLSSGSAPPNILEGVAIPSSSDLLLLSGQTASLSDSPDRPVTRDVTRAQLGDTQAQTLNILGKIEATLARRGYRMSDVVKLTVYLVGDPALGGAMDYAGMNDAYRQYFGQYFGARTNPNLATRATVQVVALAEPAFLVEIEAVAAREHAGRLPRHRSPS